MNMEQTAAIPEVELDKESDASYGKFKSAEELLKAYQSLEGEFTKRSQQLKEYEKMDVTGPIDWEGKVRDFLATYPVAERYTEEIATEIEKDGDAVKHENCLETALLSVLSKKVKTPDELAADPEVVERVITTNRDKVIEDYLQRVKTDLPKTLPKGGSAPVNAPYRPRTVAEAGELVKKIIDNQ
jgi:hypothetical protein